MKLLHYNKRHGQHNSPIQKCQNCDVPGDHPPPHVHLLGPGIKVAIEIESLKMRGRIDAKTLSEAKAWIAENRETILQIWEQRGAKR